MPTPCTNHESLPCLAFARIFVSVPSSSWPGKDIAATLQWDIPIECSKDPVGDDRIHVHISVPLAPENEWPSLRGPSQETGPRGMGGTFRDTSRGFCEP